MSDLKTFKNPFAHLANKTKVGSNSQLFKSIGLILLFSVFISLIFFLSTQKKEENLKNKPDISLSGSGGMKNLNLNLNPEDQYLLNSSGNSSGNNPAHLSLLSNPPANSQANSQADLPLHSLNNIYTGTALENSNNLELLKARENSPTTIFQEVNNLNNPNNSNNSNNSNQASHPVLAGDSNFSNYANQQSPDFDTVQARSIKNPEWRIASGELLKGYLNTAINSDLPGMIEAVLSEPVYSYLGAHLLIQKGTRLIGQYTSMSSNGAASDRIFVIWNRLITPDGRSLMINSPGADQLGRSGMGADAINTHFWKIFGTSTLLSILGAGASNMGVSSSDQPNSSDAYRQAVSGSLVNSSSQVLSQNQNIQPTLHFYQGDPISIFVARDLELL